MFSDRIPPLERIYAGPRLKFLVLGRAEVATVTPDVPYIVASITDPEQPEADIAESPLRRDVLRLKFHDMGDYGQPLHDDIVMTPDDARALLTFVQTHLGEVELIVCQCEAGVSRSAGMAAALSRLIQDEDGFFLTHYWPNRWVYRTVLDAAEAAGFRP